MAEATILVPGGVHNRNLKRAQERLKQGRQYEDLSTVIVCPTRGVIPAHVVQSWMGLIRPMNNRCIGPIFIQGAEVGEAYEQAVQFILDNEMLRKFKYMLTIEEDNVPPADGLLKLYESIKGYAAVGGLYWTKGEGGEPMIYGNPKSMLGFQPQIVKLNTVQECNGLGMGFTLFDLSVFRDKKLERPWFRTVQSVTEGQGTQDLYFFGKIRKLGYRVASDNRVKVGHYDQETGIEW